MPPRKSAVAKTVEAKKKQTSRSEKAGLLFQVGRCSRLMKQRRVAERIGAAGPTFLAAVMQYLMQEILQEAGDIATTKKQ